MTATMADLRPSVQDKLGPQCTKAQAARAVKAVVEAIVEMLAAEDALRISGLGVFEVRLSPPRTARNPRTGEPVEVPPRYRVSFRPSGALNRDLNESLETP